MYKNILSVFAATLLGGLFISAIGKPASLPQDLRTEKLLILLFDKAPEGLRGSERYNKMVDELNAKAMAELKIYPYPSTTVLRSQYEKNVNVPEHTYVLDGEVMKMINDGEVVASSNAVYVSDVYVRDSRTGTTYTVLAGKSRTQHMYLQYALREIAKRLEKEK
jgi:hypothetical protein